MASGFYVHMLNFIETPSENFHTKKSEEIPALYSLYTSMQV